MKNMGQIMYRKYAEKENNRTMKTSKISLIKLHLESGKSITAWYANQQYGLYRLGPTISKLRTKGMKIKTVMKHNEAHYSLEV